MNRHSLIFCVFTFVCLLLSGGPLPADDNTPSPEPDQAALAREKALQQVQDELQDVERRWYGLTRLRVGYPQKFSAGFGAIFVELPSDTDCSTGCSLRGWHFEVEPGLYGVQGSVGWGKLTGQTGGTKRLMHTVYLGWAVRGVVLRTYGDYRITPIASTLAGVEGSFTIVRINFSAGLLRALSSDGADDWVVTAGIGFGF